MTRSFKKTPICGHTLADSDKKDKQLFNRRMRRKVNFTLKKLKEEFDGLPEKPEHRKTGAYTFSKDGKQYLGKDVIVRK